MKESFEDVGPGIRLTSSISSLGTITTCGWRSLHGCARFQVRYPRGGDFEILSSVGKYLQDLHVYSQYHRTIPLLLLRATFERYDSDSSPST
jgi:hypothetical protein